MVMGCFPLTLQVSGVFLEKAFSEKNAFCFNRGIVPLYGAPEQRRIFRSKPVNGLLLRIARIERTFWQKLYL
jgi:hypothetical protein